MVFKQQPFESKYLRYWCEAKILSFYEMIQEETFVLFRSIVMYYWHFVISCWHEWNFSVCYCTILPLGNIGKYFAIVKQKVNFPIPQILIWKPKIYKYLLKTKLIYIWYIYDIQLATFQKPYIFEYIYGL